MKWQYMLLNILYLNPELHVLLVHINTSLEWVLFGEGGGINFATNSIVLVSRY